MAVVKGPKGPGMWVAFPKRVKLEEMLAWMVSAGFTWLAVRSGDGGWDDPSFSPAIARQWATKARERGIQVYSWHYSRPGRASQELAHVDRYLSAGMAGHIFNPEVEWAGKRDEAKVLVTLIRQRFTEAGHYVAYAPMGWKSLHGNWPYAEWGKLGDVHPQMYWTELRRGQYDQAFAAELEKYASGGHADAGVYCPIGVTYGSDSSFFSGLPQKPPGRLSDKDLWRFLDHASGCETWSLYSYEAAEPEALAFIAKESWMWKPKPEAPTTEPEPETKPEPIIELDAPVEPAPASTVCEPAPSFLARAKRFFGFQ